MVIVLSYFKTVDQAFHNLGCSSEDKERKINNSTFLVSIEASTDMNKLKDNALADKVRFFNAKQVRIS